MAGSRSLGVLTLDLVAKIGGFTQGMNQAERKAASTAASIEKKFGGLAKAIGTGLGLSIAGALTGIVAGISSAIDRMDGLRDASIRLGVGVETLSAYSFAADQLGTDIDSLGKGFKILAKNIADSAEGKGKAPVFEALGISLKDAEGNLRSLEAVIPDIADAFKQLEDGTQKAALAQELFGKTGLDLTEFLDQGSEGLAKFTDKARELGVVIDQDAADKADQFNDLLTEMKATFTGLETEIGTALLPTMIDLAHQFLEFIQDGDNAKTIADNLGGAIKGLGDIASGVVGIFEILGSTVRGVAADLHALDLAGDASQKFLRGDFEGAKESLRQAGELRAEAARQSAQIGEILASDQGKGRVATPATPFDGMFTIPGARSTFSAVPTIYPHAAGSRVDRGALGRALGGATAGGSAASRSRRGGSSGGKSDEQKEAEDLKAAYDRMNSSLAEQIDMFGKVTEEAKIRYELEHGELSKLTDEQAAKLGIDKESLIVQAQKIDDLKSEKDAADALAAVDKQRTEAVQQVLDDIRTEGDLLGQTAEYQDTYNKLKYAGVAANTAYGQSIIAANEALFQQKEAVADQIDAMDALRDAGRGIFDDLKDGVSVWDALKNAADDFANTLFKIVTNNLIEKALGQQGTSGGGQNGGWISSLLGAFFGAGGSGASGGGGLNGSFAIGGVAQAGGLYRVNEQGPELASFGGKDYLMVGAQSGTVTPISAAQGRRAGGGNTYVYNIPSQTERRVVDAVRARQNFDLNRAALRNN